MPRYDVKCDYCKKTMKKTDNVQESIWGGTCASCKKNPKNFFNI